MGVLDELKKEAQQVRAKVDEAKTSTEVKSEKKRREIEPKLKALYKYFKEFADHLNVVDPDVTGDYLLEGLGTLTNLRQREYKITTDDPEAVEKFTFHWVCSREGRQEFKVGNPVTAEMHRESLWNMNLRFNKRDLQDGAGAVFVVEAYVPVSFEFEADYERGLVRLKLKNLGALGVINHLYEPERVTGELMDELAKCVLRRPNRFDELSGNTLSDTTRQRIKEQLEQERIQRDTELRGRGGAKSKTLLGGRLFGRKT
ncbi:MAG: hypothetical protein R3286_06660 [Gammaproteobacteria bacterium]|nr:hypothetical protein [Gammaproteobacteria bacterium]